VGETERNGFDTLNTNALQTSVVGQSRGPGGWRGGGRGGRASGHVSVDLCLWPGISERSIKSDPTTFCYEGPIPIGGTKKKFPNLMCGGAGPKTRQSIGKESKNECDKTPSGKGGTGTASAAHHPKNEGPACCRNGPGVNNTGDNAPHSKK